jgi:hypothetical protein
MHYIHITKLTNAEQIARFTVENALVNIEYYPKLCLLCVARLS